jgi:hypothetical protein
MGRKTGLEAGQACPQLGSLAETVVGQLLPVLPLPCHTAPAVVLPQCHCECHCESVTG